MPIINGLDRHQLTFSSLEATIATDNESYRALRARRLDRRDRAKLKLSY